MARRYDKDKPLRALIWCAVSTRPQANEDERFSLPAQESDGVALAEREGWEIIDILRVPGHSRSYRSLEKLADDAREKGIDAFDRLINHFELGDFDVLVCKDADRFARKASLLHMIVETIIEDCHARIYSMQDGWVDAENADIFAMVKGYMTNQQIKKLVRDHARGMDKRAQRGLLVSSRNPLSHRTIRNSAGDAIRTEVKEELRRLWDDLAEVILRGVSWSNVEIVLFNDYGHARPNGRRYSDSFFYRLVHNPVFWGNNALNAFTDKRERDTQLYAPWVYDQDEPPPDGVVVYRDVLPAVWTGELAEKIKSELRRRYEVMLGTARPGNTYAFSGLILCASCGRRMTISKIKDFVYYRCNTNRLQKRRDWPKCPSKKFTKFETVRDFLTPRLERVIETGNPNIVGDVLAAPHVEQIDQIANDLATAEAELEALILDKVRSKTPEIYDRLIESGEDKVLALRDRKLKLEREQTRQARVHVTQRVAVEELRQFGIDGFWKQPETKINQLLHALMAGHVLVCSEGQIIRIMKASYNRQRI